MTPRPGETSVELPDPGAARTVDELILCLRSLKSWAGGPSYETITDRINAASRAAGRPATEQARRGTVVDCFKTGRRRPNVELILAVVHALHPDAGYVACWRQALRAVIGEARAAVQVRAQDQLPTDLIDFTGRTGELDRLRTALRPDGGAAGTVVISAIEGMAGVGKTRLAVRIGHLLAAEQPFERVLFVNLRGFHEDRTQPPADPSAVLDSFLRLLGVPGRDIPYDLAARSALFRRRLADRRALVVLDNAASEDQVRPLLPDGPACRTLVTSRRGLAGLRPAVSLRVDVFTPDEAVEYLKRAAPGVPVGTEPDALDRVAYHCGYLPLALALVAGQMRVRTGWSVTDHADRLDDRHRNQWLESGVELALSLSYEQLPADRRRLFRLLALHPGHDLAVAAAAALTGADTRRTGAQLRQLSAEHLVQPTAPDRYVLHDLVRVYADDRAGDEDRPATRRAALTRLFDHYLCAAAAAMDILAPAERERRPRIGPSATPPPPMTDPDAARDWLATERANLIATIVHAASAGWPEHAVRLAATVSSYLTTAGHYQDAVTAHTHAADAARLAGDRDAEAHALTNLGVAWGQLAQWSQAENGFRAALTLFGEVGDRLGEARALGNLGIIAWVLGRYHDAADHHRHALARYRDIGDRIGEAHTLGNLGAVHQRLGDHAAAADHQEQALTLYRGLGDRPGEARTLTNLGEIDERLGRHRQAVEHHQQAVALFVELGNRSHEGHARCNLGLALTRKGDHDRAIKTFAQALAIIREVGHRGWEAEALNGLGEALLADGRPDEARARHAEALIAAEDNGNPREQARADNGLAHAYHATGDREPARRHWHNALTRYSEHDLPEAEQVRRQLDELDTRP